MIEQNSMLKDSGKANKGFNGKKKQVVCIPSLFNVCFRLCETNNVLISMSK